MILEAWIRLSLPLPDRQLPRLRKLDMRPIGLALPPFCPPMGGTVDRFRRPPAYVLLAYGHNPLDPAEPLVEIQTYPRGGGNGRPPSLKAILARAEQRDTRLAHGPLIAVPDVWAEDSATLPRDGFATTMRAVLVEDTERQVTVLAWGSYEAFRFQHGNLTVTVLARHGLPPRPAFQPLDDLEPFITAGKQSRHYARKAVRARTLRLT